MEPIAVVATAQLPAGLGVVRISGDGALRVAARVFTPAGKTPVEELCGYRAAYGTVHEPEAAGGGAADGAPGGEALDDAVLLVFRAPHSFTGEDTAELSCHGGPYLLGRVLDAVLRAGARPAQPGEFTKRAFLAGKFDLTRAEAVMDLVGAQGDAALRAARGEASGALFSKAQESKARLLEISADIAAWVDFPEEGVPALEPENLRAALSSLHTGLRALERSFGRGRLFREGVLTAIAGRPNVGKSTLMNALAGFEKSIVTASPGTTRDVVEETVELCGLPLRLCDTAGLRETENEAERIGVARAREKIAGAQLVLAVLDSSAPLSPEDERLLAALDPARTVAVCNKSDLPRALDLAAVQERFPRTVSVSARQNEGFSLLAQAVRETVGAEGFEADEPLLMNERQLDCVRRAAEGTASALEAETAGFTLDAVSVGVEQALGALCELTGEKASDAVIDRVFEKFCIGK